jgi:hypothetical protein
MAVSDSYDDRFVPFPGGMVIAAPAVLLLLELEHRAFTLHGEGETLVVRPPDKLTRHDCARIKRWTWFLLMWLDYCAQPGNGVHLFHDRPPVALARPV